MEAVLNFIISEIFGQGAIFLALIACIGLILQKKSFSEIVRGTVMTAVGFFVLSTGTGLITGNSIDGISTADWHRDDCGVCHSRSGCPLY